MEKEMNKSEFINEILSNIADKIHLDVRLATSGEAKEFDKKEINLALFRLMKESMMAAKTAMKLGIALNGAKTTNRFTKLRWKRK